MAFDFRKFINGLRIVPKSASTASEQGDFEVLDTDGKARYHNGTTVSPVVTEAHTATLTNKSLVDNSTSIIDNSDNTKVAQFQASGISTATTRTFSFPDANTTLVGTDVIQTLTNKSIDADQNTITNIENADIKAGAAIDRTKLASGTAYRILANNVSGVMSENAALTPANVIIADANGQLAGEAQLAITRGGTGQATANAGFNALAPTTTKGDLIVHNGSINVRQPVGTNGQVLTADSGQASGVVWASPGASPDQFYELSNLALACSVASNNLTIAVKTKNGNDPSGGDQVKVGFRNSSSLGASAGYIQRSISSALSFTISSGSTLGLNGNSDYIYVYLIDSAGTVEIAASGKAHVFDEGALFSTTAEGGAGGADTAYVLYSQTARSNVAIRLIGRLLIPDLATAGVYDVLPTQSTLISNQKPQVRARYSNSGGALNTSVTIFDFDTLVYDTHNAVTTGASWIFSAPYPGFYNVSFKITTGDISGVTQGTPLAVPLYRAGVEYTVLGYGTFTGSGTTKVTAVGSARVYLNTGQQINLRPIWAAGGSTVADANQAQNWIDISNE